MACGFNTPEGKPSQLFDTLHQSNGLATAVANHEMVNSKYFADWYGNGKRTILGEPKYRNGFFMNGNGDLLPLIDKLPALSAQKAKEQSDYLTKIFSNYGVKVNVTSDPNSIQPGYVYKVADRAANIIYNPAKAKADTIFHEFGHVYVDLLGYNSPIVQLGISKLKGSELWNWVAKKNPKLNEEQLSKEVLTTAIGMEAARRHNFYSKALHKGENKFLDTIKGWLTWFGQMLRDVATVLGVNTNVAQRLAYELTSGKLRSALTGQLSDYVQYQISDDYLFNDRESAIDGLSKLRGAFKLDDSEEFYVNDNTPGVKYERATKSIEAVSHKFNVMEAMREVAVSKKPLHRKYKSISEVERLWADKREEGTGIHKIAQDYIERRNLGDKKKDAKEYALSNLHKPAKAGLKDENGVRYYSGMSRDNVETYADSLFAFIERLYSEGYHLVPELVIGSVSHGIAGTVDLIGVKADGSIDIFDFKTKETTMFNGNFISSFDTFNKRNVEHPYLLGPFSDIPNNTANKYAIQLSIYKSILEHYGFKVNGLYIVPLVGEIEQTDAEFRYKNLRLYTNNEQENFKGSVYHLLDLSNKVNEMFNTKDDFLTVSEQVEAFEETSDEFRARLAQISNLTEWIKDVVVDLHRSIVPVQELADKYTADEYKAKMQYLVDRMLVDDEFEALAVYQKYLIEEIQTISNKLFTREVEVDGNVTIVKGYSTLTWNEIKTMEKEDPVEFMNFVGFLVNTESFLGQVVYIKNLPKTVSNDTGTAVDTLAKTIKANEADISDLQWHINKLNRELNMRYFEMSSNPIFKSNTATEAMKQFFEAYKDENWFQANVDSMADTHHPFIANVVKMVQRTKHKADTEARRLVEQYIEKTKDVNVMRLVDVTSGRLVTESDYEAFTKAMHEMYDEAAVLFPNKKDAKAKFINNWFVNNTVRKSDDEIKQLEQRKKKLLGKRFKAWQDRQFIRGNNYTLIENRKGAYYKPNPAIYSNAAFENLTPHEVETLTYVRELLYYLVEHAKERLIENGYIPAIHNSNRTDMEKLLAGVGFHNAHEKPLEGDFDRDGNLIHLLPFKYVEKFGQQKLLDETEANSDMTVEDIRAQNEIIKLENKARHAAAINMDLNEVMPIFIRSSINHKHKHKIRFELHRTYNSFINDFKIIESKNGAFFVDKAKKFIGKTPNHRERSTSDSKLAKHFKNYIEQVFYEQPEIDEGGLTVAGRVLQNFTSIKNMAFNGYSALNNTIYGTIMTRLEGAGGEYYTNKDWNWAGIEYFNAILSYFGDNADRVDFGTKQSAFMQEFPIMMDYRETAVNKNDAAYQSAILNGTAWLVDKAFLLQHLSEHMLQNRLLLSMANSHKIVNGRIITFADFMNDLPKTNPKLTNAENEAIIKDNKAKRKEMIETWKGFTTVYNAYEFVTNDTGRGTLVLKEEFKGMEDEFADFKIRTLKVNQKNHGIYNREDAGVIQRYALGRLAMQFRKWLRPGFNKRYGSRFGEDYWNESRQGVDAGIYSTTVKFLAKPYLNWKAGQQELKESNEQMDAIKAMGNLIKSYGDFVTNAKVHWHSLDNWEKAAIRQAMLEWATFTTLTLIAAIFLNAKGDDDDKGLPYYVVAQQLDRAVLEMSTYVPLAIGFGKDKPFIGGGLFNEYNKMLKSPFAAVATVEKVFLLGTELISYPFLDEEDRMYESGAYHGQTKLAVKFQQLIPIYNQYFRTANLESTYRYYRLF